MNGGSIASTLTGTPGVLIAGKDESETASFAANGAKFSVANGEIILARSVTARAKLSGNQFLGQSRDFAVLRAEEGASLTVVLEGQVLEGDISADSASEIELTLASSYYMGAINSADSANSVALNLDANSNVILAGDSYISSLVNIDSENQNIYANGYKLYLNGREVAINGSEVMPEVPEMKTEEKKEVTETIEEVMPEAPETENATKNTPNILFFILGGIVVALAIAIPIVIIKKQKTS